jgi:hypothetical protein
MRLILNHLRSHVLESPTEGISLLTVVGLDAPSKVADFNDIAFLYENIFWFDVSMDKSLFVHVVDAWTDLNEEVKGSVFTQILLSPNEVEEVAFASELQNEVDGVFVFEAAVESTYVLVVKLFLNPNLPNQSFLNLAACERGFLYFLNGY